MRARREWGWGLSPRTRGNLAVAGDEGGHQGSIPANAGEPATSTAASCATRVYPRERGGTGVRTPRRRATKGLSPRTRGNLADPRMFDTLAGSIPANAGEPPRRARRLLTPRVYPRERGGTWTPANAAAVAAGLSPRTRGNRRRDGRAGQRLGSIPANAGEPARPSASSRQCGVYPRERGGTCANAPTTTRSRGLSPRTRGNRSDGEEGRASRRSIPANAGEPACRRTW